MRVMARLIPNQYRCKVFAGIFIILVIVYYKYIHRRYEIIIPKYQSLNLDEFPDLGVTAAEIFPETGDSRIPKIIHQTWKTTDIPQRYIDWIKSWVIKHPQWRYMFWTDASARQLIVDKHPELLPYYDGYLDDIRRADAMRYVILYEYGGVYADLDMESLQPLDSISRKYACFLPQEPYEHPIMDKNSEHLLINAFMACRAGHPLMKKFMDSLPAHFHMWSLLDSTGPHYITLLYNQYVSETKLDPTHENGVYLAPAEYFFPTIDPTKFSYLKTLCSTFEKITKKQQTACVSLKKRGLVRKPYPFSFTDHHWAHTYFKTSFSIWSPVSINKIVKQVEMYTEKPTNGG